jgi:ferredoxin
MQDDIAITKMEVIPPGLEKKCREAFEACPVEAILVEE